jgi:hypothetical protein
MKKVLLTLLVVFLILGALGAAGYAGYRYGFRQGFVAASDGDAQFFMPGFGLNRMPMHDFGFDRGSDRGFDRNGFGMMQRSYGFSFFRPLGFLIQLLFWGLIIWGISALITRSGWQLSRTPPADITPPPRSTDDNNPPEIS